MPHSPNPCPDCRRYPLVRSGLELYSSVKASFQVIAEASDGYQAIELALEHKPDLAVLDVGMPRLNGTDAAQHISSRLPSARL